MGGIALVMGCADPSDILYESEISVPREVAPGLFQLTYNLGPDYVRGITSDGRVLYVTTALEGGPVGTGLVSVDPAGGAVREEAGAYRTLLPRHIASDYVVAGSRRILLTLLPRVHRKHWCGDTEQEPPPPGTPELTPAVVGWRMFVLPSSDGPAFSSLVSYEREFPLFVNGAFTPAGRPATPKRIQFVPALVDADSLGTRAFGPALDSRADVAYISDADTVWRVSMSDSTVPRLPVTTGTYPLLAPGGDALYVARPNVVDSLETVTVMNRPDAPCTQTIVTYTVADWSVIRVTLATGSETLVGAGTDQTLLGDTALVVRRPGGLHVLRLADGTSQLLMADSTATSPAVASDGSFVAFTSRRTGNPDIFVLRLN